MLSVEINEELLNMFRMSSLTLARRSVMLCSERYNFDSEEALRYLNLSDVSVNITNKKKERNEIQMKPNVAFPFNGVMVSDVCHGIQLNGGLYTQCTNAKVSGCEYCKTHKSQAEKNESNIPDHGTIEERMKAGLYEYKDPSGKGPISFIKYMKKNNLNEEQVREEAAKFNIVLNELHFEYVEAETKKGRPKMDKPPKEVKQGKGRPKKERKSVEIENDSDDIFASIISEVNSNDSDSEMVSFNEDNSDNESILMSQEDNASCEAELEAKKAELEAKKKADAEAKKAELEAKKKADAEAKKAELEAKKKADAEAKKAELEAKKKADAEAKKAELEAKKAEMESMKKADAEAKKAELEAKKKADQEKKKAEAESKKAELEAKKKADAEAKKAELEAKKKADAEAKKAELEAKKKSEEEAKVVSSSQPQSDDENVDKVRKITHEGVKYYQSTKTGIIYNMTQDEVGIWNKTTNTIDFYEASSDVEEDEECVEDSYDE